MADFVNLPSTNLVYTNHRSVNATAKEIFQALPFPSEEAIKNWLKDHMGKMIPAFQDHQDDFHKELKESVDQYRSNICLAQRGLFRFELGITQDISTLPKEAQKEWVGGLIRLCKP